MRMRSDSLVWCAAWLVVLGYVASPAALMAQDQPAAEEAAAVETGEKKGGFFDFLNPFNWFKGSSKPAEEAPAAESADPAPATDPAPAAVADPAPAAAADPAPTPAPSTSNLVNDPAPKGGVLDAAVHQDFPEEKPKSSFNLFNPFSWFGGGAAKEEAEEPAVVEETYVAPEPVAVEPEPAKASGGGPLDFLFGGSKEEPAEEEEIILAAEEPAAPAAGPLEIIFAPIGWLFGPKDISKHDVWSDMSPELVTIAETPDEHETAFRRTIDTNGRSFWDDFRRFWLLDRPNRSSPYPIP